MSPMALRSLNLPGVGTKYEFETDKGDTVAIFFTKTGTIQMYTLQKGCHTPSAAAMTPVEARRLGNILTGAIIEADQESVEIAFSALADLRITIHSYIVPRAIAGKTIEDLRIRAKTGTTVIAVSRNDKNIINPPPSFVFETGDAGTGHRGNRPAQIVRTRNHGGLMEGIIIALFVCLVLALVSKYLTIPAIPFYIIAGVVLGQAGLGIVASDQISSFFSEMGLIFLLFFVGLGLKIDKISENQSEVLTSGIIDLNVNLLIGFVAAYLLGFSLVEALIVAAAFYSSSTAMTVTSLIENRKLMMKESGTIIWLMVFEDLVLIVILAILSAGNENLLLFAVEILAGLGLVYALAHYGKEFLVSILERDDELPVLFTFVAVVATAGFALYFGVPDTLMVIALGAAFATTDPDAFEQHARPFKDVFMVIFFVFFGITINLSGGVNISVIAIICILAIASKLISGVLTGIALYGSARSGLEIWANTIARGEFSIALAVLYGSPPVAATIAVMVIVTSLVGSFAAKYSGSLSRGFAGRGRRHGPPHRVHASH